MPRSLAFIVCTFGLLAPVHRRAVAQQPPAPLPPVTVVGSLTRATDAGRSVDVITREDIERSSARNLAELLALRPGVDVYARSPAQADVSLRGSTAEQTLILVDGFRVSDAQSAHYNLDLAVPLDAIERVEILRGTASSLYGPDAVGGVVNIVTRSTYVARELRTRGGAWGTGGIAADFGRTVGGWNIAPMLEYEKSDGWRAGTDHRIGSARIAFARLAPGNRVQAHIGTGIRDFGANAFYGPYDSFERTGATTGDVSWERNRGTWVFDARGSTRYHTDRYTLVRSNPALYENLHRSWQTGGALGARHGFAGGVMAVAADVSNAQLVSARLGSRAEWRHGGAAQVTWGDRGATLDLGVRGDQSSVTGGFLSPSVAVSVPLAGAARARFNAARGFRAPTWTERYYADPVNAGDPNLLPERFWSGEAGIALPGPRGVLDVAVFGRRADNLIDWVRPAGAAPGVAWQATNVGTATYLGLDGSLAVTPPGGVGYTFAVMALRFSDLQGAGLDGKYALRPVTRQVSLRARWAMATDVAASVEVMQSRRAGEDAFVTGNARITWTPHPAWAVTFDIVNLANAGWLDASGQVVASRALYVGLTWRGS